MQQKKPLILTIYLSFFLLWLGLGINKNIPDTRFWVETTKLTILFEWFFIFLYVTLFKTFPSLHSLWEKHQLIVMISFFWLITVSLSFLLSPYYDWKNQLALIRFIETISHFFFFVFLWDFFNKNNVNYSIIFIIPILSSLLVLTYVMYLHYTYPDLQASNYGISIDSQEYVLNTQFRRIGYLLEISIIFTFAFLFLKKYQYISLLTIVILFVSLIAIGGRAALLGTLLAFGIYFIYFKKNIPLKKFMMFIIAIIILLLSSIYFNFLPIEHIIHDMNRTIQAPSLNRMTAERINAWLLILQNLEDQWIIGGGPQSYFFYIDRSIHIVHAHNFILQFLGEWGILGTLLFLTLLYRALNYGATLHLRDDSSNKERYYLAAGVAIISLSVTGLFGGIYFFPQTTVYLIFCFALWITPSKNLNHRKYQ